MNLNMYKVLSDMSRYNLTDKLYLKLVLTCLVGFVISLILYIFYNNEQNWYNLSDKKQMSFSDCLFYTFTCWFTLGFGEIIPKSISAKFISVITMFLAYIVILI